MVKGFTTLKVKHRQQERHLSQRQVREHTQGDGGNCEGKTTIS